MTSFGQYARHYDLLYRDKDYAGEVDYVEQLLRRGDKQPDSVLDLGCGTGRHSAILASRGYDVVGLDRAPDMVAAARARSVEPQGRAGRLVFREADIRTCRLDRRFDAVVALFHVLSYLTTEEALTAAFQTAAAHLNPAGTFVFDFWYGPAVLSQRPSIRVKRCEDKAAGLTRLAEPILDPRRNTVEVAYTLFVREPSEGRNQEIRERHVLRYLFEPEISRLAMAAGLEVVRLEESFTGRTPGLDTWSVTGVATMGKRECVEKSTPSIDK